MPLVLRKPKSDVARELEDRVRLGEYMLAAHKNDDRALGREAGPWDAFNKDLLPTLFHGDDACHEYKRAGAAAVLSSSRRRIRVVTQKRIDSLKALLARLELAIASNEAEPYPGATTVAAVQPPLDDETARILLRLYEMYQTSRFQYENTGGVYEHKLANSLDYPLDEGRSPVRFLSACRRLEAAGLVVRRLRSEDFPENGIWPTETGLHLSETLRAQDKAIGEISSSPIQTARDPANVVGAPATPLEPPRDATIGWLSKNVPVKQLWAFALFIVSVIAAAFSAGQWWESTGRLLVSSRSEQQKSGPNSPVNVATPKPQLQTAAGASAVVTGSSAPVVSPVKASVPQRDGALHVGDGLVERHE
jgi:hypothetical protein